MLQVSSWIHRSVKKLEQNGLCEEYFHVLIEEDYRRDVAHMVAVMLAELAELASTPVPTNP